MADDWLDEEELRAWRALIVLTQLLPGALDRQLQADSGLAHSDYAVLATLSSAPGHRLRMSDLAALMDFSPSRLSHGMTRIERADWVRRVPCKSDKRVQYAELTDRGQAVLAEAAPAHVGHVRRLVFDHLTSATGATTRDHRRADPRAARARRGVLGWRRQHPQRARTRNGRLSSP